MLSRSLELTGIPDRYNPSANMSAGEISPGERVHKEKNNKGLRTKLWKIPQSESRMKWRSGERI